jgi:hypothetical protein
MLEISIKIRLIFLRLFFNPIGEAYFVRFKRLIEKSIVFQKEYSLIINTSIRDKLSDLIDPKLKHEQTPVYTTTNYVQFGLLQFGSTLSSFNKNFAKKPDLVVFEHFEKHLFTVYIYKEQLLGRKVRRNYVFCDGEYFLGEVIIPMPTRITHQTNSSVLTNLQIKTALISDLHNTFHLASNNQSQDFFTIKSNDNSLVQFQDNGFSFQIKYFSRKNEQLYSTLVRLYQSNAELDPSNSVIIRQFLSGAFPVVEGSYA